METLGLPSALATGVPVDMVAYLFAVGLLPVMGLGRAGPDDRLVLRWLLTSQISLVVLFFLVWGGYAKDSWDYLTGFDGSPFTYDDEWLFWIAGHLLGKLLIDPWPLKVLSAAAAATLCAAIVAYFHDRDIRYSAVGLFALLLVPAFLLLVGSAIRQGLAGALVVLAIVNLHRDRNRMFVLLSVLAFFLHQYSMLLVLAGLLSKLNTRFAVHALVIAPFVSFAASWLGSMAGMDVEGYITYSGKHEGDFHWEKFFVSYALVSAALFIAPRAERRDAGMIAAYAYMVACSALFLKYEVPFERLLYYSELLLPFVAAIGVGVIGWHGRRLAVLWIGAMIAGVVLWSHPSIIATLGYSAA